MLTADIFGILKSIVQHKFWRHMRTVNLWVFYLEEMKDEEKKQQSLLQKTYFKFVDVILKSF